MPLDHRSAVVSTGTHKPLQAKNQANVHALREHSGPRAGCRVTSFRCAAPCFIFSFAVENFRDVRRADSIATKVAVMILVKSVGQKTLSEMID
jgi:hypothetical protein